MADVSIDPKSTNTTALVAQGVRAFAIHDYNTAVQAFSKVSELVVKENGEKHDTLGEVYLYYGKSLLELSREETEALGDAVTKNIDESSSDDEDVETAETAGDKAESKPEEAKTNGAEMNIEPCASGSGNRAVKTKEDNSESTAEKPEDANEEPTDLQVAWEVLELAKLIFQQRGEAGNKCLAEALITLGEVSLESENFEAAIIDIKQALELQKNIYPADSRTLAESYYKLGIALSTSSKLDEAVENFNTSLEILRNRIKNLIESEDKKKHADEVKEMESLIPEIEEKIADMKALKEEAIRKLTTVTESVKISSPTKNEDGSSKVNNISHLVRRKRKVDNMLEDKGKESDVPAKKPTP